MTAAPTSLSSIKIEESTLIVLAEKLHSEIWGSTLQDAGKKRLDGMIRDVEMEIRGQFAQIYNMENVVGIE